MKIQNLGSSIYAPNSARAFAIAPRRASLRPFQNSEGLLSRAWSWIRTRQAARTSARRLQVATTVSLGEKRFLAVIHVDGAEFLIGGGATNVALLAQLNQKESFGGLLNETMTSPKKQPVKRLKKRSVAPAAKQAKEQQPAKRSRKQNVKPTAKRAKEAA
jgi:flagellar biogenesis protein FliO